MTSLKFEYHSLRGFLRQPLSCLPMTVSQVHFTSALVKGLPSCHFTPSRSLKVTTVLSGLQLHDSARSGTIVSSVFCFAVWS